MHSQPRYLASGPPINEQAALQHVVEARHRDTPRLAPVATGDGSTHAISACAMENGGDDLGRPTAVTPQRNKAHLERAGRR